MSLVDKILNIIAPYDCLKCGQEGELLCSSCLAALPSMPERCHRCHKPSARALTCVSCSKYSDIGSVQVAAVYEGACKDLLWKLKSGGSQAAAAIMASKMHGFIEPYRFDLIVPVPTSTGRIRERGYDQAALLARNLSKLSGLPCLPCLRRLSKAHQVGVGRKQRLMQLRGAFVVANPRHVKGMRVILIDDVVTTGSTLESAAAAMKNAGALRIDAITFAQPLSRH